MAKKPDDALARYVQSHFPTSNPHVAYTPPTLPGEHGTPGGTSSESGAGAGPPYVVPEQPSGGGEKNNPPLDWRAYLENWGFDADIVAELDRIFRTYTDADAAAHSALAYIRGTEWYKKTFPGIEEGMKLGVIGDERSYRAYMNQLNDLYHRYYGRDITGDEVAQALKAGHGVSWINSDLLGQAYIKANKGDIQYELGAFDENGQLSEDQLKQYGQYKGGLDNMLGPELERRIGRAKQRMLGVFSGSLASPNFALNKFGRLTAPSLSGGINPNDVSA